MDRFEANKQGPVMSPEGGGVGYVARSCNSVEEVLSCPYWKQTLNRK